MQIRWKCTHFHENARIFLLFQENVRILCKLGENARILCKLGENARILCKLDENQIKSKFEPIWGLGDWSI